MDQSLSLGELSEYVDEQIIVQIPHSVEVKKVPPPPPVISEELEESADEE